MKTASIKWIPLLLAMCMFSAAANIVALRTIHRLEIENKLYEQNIDILKQKIVDCLSDLNAAVGAAKPESK